MPRDRTRVLTSCDKRGEAVGSDQSEVERMTAGRRSVDENEGRLLPRLGEPQDRRCGWHLGSLEGCGGLRGVGSAAAFSSSEGTI